VPKVFHIAAKDFRLIVRDKAAFLIMLGMPLALIFILGSALGGVGESEIADIPVAIANEDEGGAGADFSEGITEVDTLQELFNIEVTDDVAGVRSSVERGDLVAALVIPPEFSDRLATGEPVSLEVLQDPGSEVVAGIWAGVARAAAANLSAGQVVRASVEAALEDAGLSGGPDAAPGAPDGGDHAMSLDAVRIDDREIDSGKTIGMIDFYAAGQTAMFLLFTAMFGAFTFVKERREQTLARALATPTTSAEVVGGKALGTLSVAAGQFLVLYLGTQLLFRVDWGAHPAGTIALGLSEAVAATGLGMALAALGKTERAIGGIGPAVIMLFGAVGGSMLPAEFMPAWMKPLQAISPVYWTLEGYLGLMQGDPLGSVVPYVAILLVMGVALTAFGVWRLRYE
jgi:ABC-2 type transport system permease protein